MAEAQSEIRRAEVPKKIVIIGTGLAGLAGAYELSQPGHDVTVLEARTSPEGAFSQSAGALQSGNRAAREVTDRKDKT